MIDWGETIIPSRTLINRNSLPLNLSLAITLINMRFGGGDENDLG